MIITPKQPRNDKTHSRLSRLVPYMLRGKGETLLIDIIVRSKTSARLPQIFAPQATSAPTTHSSTLTPLSTHWSNSVSHATLNASLFAQRGPLQASAALPPPLPLPLPLLLSSPQPITPMVPTSNAIIKSLLSFIVPSPLL
jgi:hypothetical protein